MPLNIWSLIAAAFGYGAVPSLPIREQPALGGVTNSQRKQAKRRFGNQRLFHEIPPEERAQYFCTAQCFGFARRRRKLLRGC